MKTFFSVTAFFIFISLSAQSFDKGVKVVEAQFELGAYSTTSHDKINNTTDDKNGTATKIVNGSFEYGVLPWLGVGTKVQYDIYFSNDSVTPKPTAHSFDWSATGNVHVVRKDHFDLVLGANFGVSFFHYGLNDPLNSQANGTGSWIDLHLSPRFYFGDHFGINLNFAYANFNYPNVVEKSSAQTSINAFSLKGSGGNFGAGLQFRF
jgi:hypothetical protein